MTVAVLLCFLLYPIHQYRSWAITIISGRPPRPHWPLSEGSDIKNEWSLTFKEGHIVTDRVDAYQFTIDRQEASTNSQQADGSTGDQSIVITTWGEP